MTSPVIAVYPGTFDPLTLGHEDIVRRAARMFDRVVIAVAMAHHKKTLFTLPERLALTREAMADCSNVEVDAYDGLVVDYLAQRGATVMVRGVRSVTDFDYEFQLAGMNRRLSPRGGHGVAVHAGCAPVRLQHPGARDQHARGRRGAICVTHGVSTLTG